MPRSCWSPACAAASPRLLLPSHQQEPPEALLYLRFQVNSAAVRRVYLLITYENEQRNHRPNTPDVDCGVSSLVFTDLRAASACFLALQEWMLAKTHRRLAGRRLSESLQQSHKVVIPVKRQSRYKCGSFAYPGFPLIGFLAQIKFCLPVDYEDLCPLWKKHFILFLRVCFVFPYKVFSEASYNCRSVSESHSTRWLGVRAACSGIFCWQIVWLFDPGWCGCVR